MIAEPSEEHGHGATNSKQWGMLSIPAGNTEHLGSTVHPQNTGMHCNRRHDRTGTLKRGVLTIPNDIHLP